MDDFRRQDPTFTDYVAKTCSEAVGLFYKMKTCGEIDFNELDVALRKCARGLDQSEFEKFVKWIHNPSCAPEGDLPDCFPKNGIILPAPDQDEKTE